MIWISVVVALVLQLAIVLKAEAQNSGPAAMSEVARMAPGEVVAVVFEGNNNLSTAELTTVVSTKVTSGLSRLLYKIPFFGKTLGSQYQGLDYSTMEHDTAVLNFYYRDKGFLSARSNFRVGVNLDDLKAFNDYIKRHKLYKGPPGGDKEVAPALRDTVIYMIKEGPPYTIGRIAFQGLETLPSEFQPELTEHNTIKSGTRWSRGVAATEVERLDSIMIESGYPFFKSDTIVVENTVGKTTVNVLVYFSPGHRYRYGKPEITYDTTSVETVKVADKVVLAQLLLPEGSWYKLSEIQRSESNIYRLNAFDIVRVTLDTDYISSLPDSARDSAKIPIDVFLRAKRRAELTPGVFAGTGSQGIVLGVTGSYQNRNLTGGADNINLQGSYQFLPTSQTRYSASTDYVIPYIGLGRVPLILGFGGSVQLQRPAAGVSTYDQRSLAIHAGLQFILSKTDNKTTLNPDLALEYILSQTDNVQLRKQLPKYQVNLLPSVNYQDDRSNDILNPTSGSILSALVEYAVPNNIFRKPAANYLKVVPQIKEYLDLSGGKGTMVLASRLEVGVTKEFGDDSLQAPSWNRRFFGGGSSTIRGWQERTLLESRNQLRDPTVEGGYNELIANAEIRYAPFQYAEQFTSWEKLSSALRAVFFYDIGNVWDNVLWTDTKEELAFSKLAQSVGIGIRYNMFFGALRFDWGIKLYDPSGRFDNGLMDTPDGTQHISTLPSERGAWIWDKKPRFGFNVFNFSFAIGQAF